MTKQQAKRRVALKGQSRSKFCGEPIRRGSKTPCLRLQGHAGKHRPTTFRHPKDAEQPIQPVVEVKPEPTIIAAVEVERQVAAPSKTAKRRNSGQPTVPSAKPTRSKIG